MISDSERPIHNEQAIYAALSTISDLIYVYDQDCRLVYGNQALLDLWGAKLEDLAGQHVRDFLRDDPVADQVEAHIRQVVETGEPVSSEVEYTSHTGATGYFEYIFRPFEHVDGVWVIGSTRDVSERKYLADELSWKSEELNDILESISDAFYTLDTEWRITYANSEAIRLVQKDREVLLGTSIWDVFPEAVGTEVYTLYHRVMETQVSESIHFFFEPLDTWFEIHAYPSADHLSVYFRDNNEQVRIQRELAANERRYRTLTNAMPQMVWLTDSKGQHLYYNDRWYEFTGLTKAESLGFGFTNALHPADHERTLKKWEQAWKHGEQYEIEYRFYSRSLGEYRWFLGRAFPVYDEDGNVTEWVGTCTDIELQKQTEARLIESERRLAEAQRIARVGNWEYDFGTAEFTFSDEYLRIFGIESGTVICSVEQLAARIHPEDRDAVFKQRDRILEQGGGAYDIEYRVVLPSGEERVLHTLAELVTDDDQNPEKIIGTVHEITERKEIEQALEEHTRQQTLLSRQLQHLNSTLEEQVEARTIELKELSENLESIVRERTAELEQRRAELAHQAQHDPLTDLPNRILFEDRLENAIARADRTERVVAVLFVDLDGFKLVNDSFGHAAGDTVLEKVALRLAERIRRSDTLARHGGDEFVVLLEELSHPDEALIVANQLLEAVNLPVDVVGQAVRLSASIGVALYPQDAKSVVGLQRLADVAMYRAKSSGKNDIRFYSPSMNAAAEERLEIGTQLTGALDKGELSLQFQPQFSVASGRIESAEALLRWHNPVIGSVSPARLIPLAEELGLMIEIGAWVLDQSCEAAARWKNLTGEPVRVAVNISSSQLDRGDFVSAVAATLERHGLAPGQLELELTESSIMRSIDDAAERLIHLRALGVRVTMDDFGLGSSSLTNLVRLPLDTVKIDRAFIRDMIDSHAADRVVQAIVSLASGIGLEVVAEGIETIPQRERAIELGCDRLQGFLIGFPMERRLIEQILTDPPRPSPSR